MGESDYESKNHAQRYGDHHLYGVFDFAADEI
jgi:hypothetical protein